MKQQFWSSGDYSHDLLLLLPDVLDPELRGIAEYADCMYPCRRVRFPNGCPWYDTKKSDGEVSVMLELLEMLSTLLLPSLPGPLWPGGVGHDRVFVD